MVNPTHPGAGDTGLLGPTVATAALLAAILYLLAAARLRRRGDTWPRRRDAFFALACGGPAYALVGSVPGGPFTAHMTQHLAVAMAFPLLLVLARPLTLTLRLLPGGAPARRALLAVAHSRPVTGLLFPPLATVLDIGGLWVLYRTPLLSASHHQPLLNVVVHVHVLGAGLLFTFAVCQLDPVRRPWNLYWRGTALLAAGWAHAVLAKSLYATPPPGTAFATSDVHTASQLMYYSGDLVEVALAAVVASHWYTTTGRAHRRSTPAHTIRRPSAAGGPCRGTGSPRRRPTPTGTRRPQPASDPAPTAKPAFARTAPRGPGEGLPQSESGTVHIHACGDGTLPTHEKERGRIMQENTPSQAEGERPDDESAQDAERRPQEAERTTPSQAEGDRESNGDGEAS
ncbi:cytochrome c oxidase assembly protein [Streptomyces sp. EN23]|uniref:cytochrome c oxidase assembly protein n=1 Tax=Streptomyces sp. EN23 TaxID=212774 RepID=UPI00099F67C8|nr:cytochrome c oxidase assembly protein [Streptomyces sp. EN23]